MCSINPEQSTINDFIDSRLASATSEKIAIVMVGGPGSGKSSGKSQTITYLKKQPKNFVNIDPDEIITNIFNNDTNCYTPVEKINNESFKMAIAQNKNIVFDGTGRNFEWYSKNVIKLLKDLGYNVNLVVVSNNVKRIQKRAEEEGRNVNAQYTTQVYKTLETAIAQYLDLDCDFTDNIFLYDNSDTLKLILHTSCVNGVKQISCKYISGVCDPIMRAGRNKKRYIKSRKLKKKKSKKSHRLRSYTRRKYI